MTKNNVKELSDYLLKKTEFSDEDKKINIPLKLNSILSELTDILNNDFLTKYILDGRLIEYAGQYSNQEMEKADIMWHAFRPDGIKNEFDGIERMFESTKSSLETVLRNIDEFENALKKSKIKEFKKSYSPPCITLGITKLYIKDIIEGIHASYHQFSEIRLNHDKPWFRGNESLGLGEIITHLSKKVRPEYIREFVTNTRREFFINCDLKRYAEYQILSLLSKGDENGEMIKAKILTPENYLEKLLPGDILITLNMPNLLKKHPLRWAISRYTMSLSTHASTYVGNGEIAESRPYFSLENLFKMRIGKARKTKLSVGKDELVVVKRPELKDEERGKLMEGIDRIIKSDCPYNLLGLVGIGIYRMFGYFPKFLNGTGLVCAPFDNEQFSNINHYMTGRMDNSKYVAPADLLESKKLRLMYILYGNDDNNARLTPEKFEGICNGAFLSLQHFESYFQQ